jgi:hypothetical protein
VVLQREPAARRDSGSLGVLRSRAAFEHDGEALPFIVISLAFHLADVPVPRASSA